jgi:hypothetical protein
VRSYLESLPYATIQLTHLAFEVANGCWHDPMNALAWESISLNLPGSASFTPTLPWVSQLRKDGSMAGATPAFVGDLRLVRSSEDHCFQVAHQTASRLGYLGIQNASRKTRPPSQTPGAWAGVIAEVGWAGIGIKTSQEK